MDLMRPAIVRRQETPYDAELHQVFTHDKWTGVGCTCPVNNFAHRPWFGENHDPSANRHAQLQRVHASMRRHGASIETTLSAEVPMAAFC
jgi:hypothetical protein